MFYPSNREVRKNGGNTVILKYCHPGVPLMVLLAAGITSALENIFVMNALSISIERKASRHVESYEINGSLFYLQSQPLLLTT